MEIFNMCYVDSDLWRRHSILEYILHAVKRLCTQFSVPAAVRHNSQLPVPF